MGNFFAELKRRHMFRVAAAYAVVAWLLLQIVNNVAPGLNLPSSAITLVIVLLAVGFPVALVFAWIHELWAPSLVDGTSAQAKITRLDFALVGDLLAFGVFQVLEHQLHVVEDLAQVADDGSDLFDSPLNGLHFRRLKRR